MYSYLGPHFKKRRRVNPSIPFKPFIELLTGDYTDNITLLICPGETESTSRMYRANYRYTRTFANIILTVIGLYKIK